MALMAGETENARGVAQRKASVAARHGENNMRRRHRRLFVRRIGNGVAYRLCDSAWPRCPAEKILQSPFFDKAAEA
jgi:hypothetical protein